jgi:hypothetical protein
MLFFNFTYEKGQTNQTLHKNSLALYDMLYWHPYKAHWGIFSVFSLFDILWTNVGQLMNPQFRFFGKNRSAIARLTFIQKNLEEVVIQKIVLVVMN